ncbi:BEL1-like homeodomain protein 7 [Acorus calamus]|uniref:BEL1-like homeodomain protein 7 n=1 Tax=Acorus calamus TaxID=4465 RepID=A0AAV9D4Q5_ACOCL|nr:BEL1-like homeodomain protein 7 [Acorus calamus]
MATFYSNSGDQRDVMPTLYPNNMLYYSDNLAGNSHDLPVVLPQDLSIGTLESDRQQGFLTNLLASHLGEQAYSRNEMMFMHPEGEMPRNSVPEDHQMGILHGQMMHGQGLSLSLSTQIQSSIPVSAFQYRQPSLDISFMGPPPHQSNTGSEDDNKHLRNAETPKSVHMNTSPCGLLGPMMSTNPNSKYLKAAQELLDEVVNVRKALMQKCDKSQSLNNASVSGKDSDGGSKGDGESNTNSTPELSAAERQDLQNKMAKLLSMLDEVDRRYKQYFHQMQIVVSSFDAIAGNGGAKPYTALALQKISRHFRCLRDAITGQIRATRRSLGEQDSQNGSKGVGISRLRFIDQHLRQQRAFQQLGMVQQQAWRPQRGLPESSVTILRAWLFEHFLHPYPKDSDKLMLARQTGLTRSQVSNWFINARVRLWKPMVEEMYKEETGDIEMDSNSSSDNAQRARDDARVTEDWGDEQTMKSINNQASQFNDQTKAGDEHDDNEDAMASKLRNQSPNTENYSLLENGLVQPDANGRFMAYQMAELGRFGNGGGGVSLTLGLQQDFVTVRGDDMYNAPSTVGTEPTDYDCLNLTNRQHKFGPPHLLRDFVA